MGIFVNNDNYTELLTNKHCIRLTIHQWLVIGEIMDNFNNFKFDVYDVDAKLIGDVILYNMDDEISLTDWLKDVRSENKTTKGLCVKSPLRTSYSERGTMVDKALGYLLNAGNNMEKSARSVGLMSIAFSNAHGESIESTNLKRAFLTMAFRRSYAKHQWFEEKKEFIAPTFKSKQHQQQVYTDAIIFSIFNNQNQTGSLRDIKYDNKTFQVENHFFPFSKKIVQSLIDLYIDEDDRFDLIEEDMNRYGRKDRIMNRIIERYLRSDSFSEEALDVYNKALSMYKNAFKYFVDEEYQEKDVNGTLCTTYLNEVWDTSWYQMKIVIENRFKDDYKEFKNLYNKLEKRMRQHVIDCGVIIPNEGEKYYDFETNMVIE